MGASMGYALTVARLPGGSRPPWAAGIEPPETTAQQRPTAIQARFLCLSSSMVGCARHPYGWPVPVAGRFNLVQPAALIRRLLTSELP